MNIKTLDPNIGVVVADYLKSMRVVEQPTDTPGNSHSNIFLKDGVSDIDRLGLRINSSGDVVIDYFNTAWIQALTFTSTNLITPQVFSSSNLKQGIGAPEGVVSGVVGDLYEKTDAPGGLYIKETGSGNTGWAILVTSTSAGLSGSGTVGQIAYWNTTNSLASLSNLIYDNTLTTGGLTVTNTTPVTSLSSAAFKVLGGSAFVGGVLVGGHFAIDSTYSLKYLTVSSSLTLTRTITAVKITASGITLGLWTNPSQGDTLYIKHSGSLSPATISGSPYNIEGQSTLLLYNQETIMLIFNGVQWEVF